MKIIHLNPAKINEHKEMEQLAKDIRAAFRHRARYRAKKKFVQGNTARKDT